MELSTMQPKVEAHAPQAKQSNQAEAMKSIRKARLQRQVLADPAMAARLVSVEASPVYNARGDVVQAVSSDLGTA